MKMKKRLALLLALVMMAASFAMGEVVSEDIETVPVEAASSELEGWDLGANGLLTEADEPLPEPEAIPEAEEAPLPEAFEEIAEDLTDIVSKDGEETPPTPKTIQLSIDSKAEVEMNLGDTLIIRLSDSAKVVKSWTSGNKKVVKTIDVDGGVATVNPIAAGTAKLTVKYDKSKSFVVTVKVIDPYMPRAVHFKNEMPAEIPVGTTLNLEDYVGLEPSYARTTYTWKCSGSAAKVDKTGKLTAQKAGTATLTVTCADKKTKTTYKLTVLSNKVDKLSEKPTSADIATVSGGWTLWPLALEVDNKGALQCQFYILNGTALSGSKIENMNLSIALGTQDNVIARHMFASQKASVGKGKAVVLKLTIPAASIIAKEPFFLPDFRGSIYFNLDLNSSFRLVAGKKKIAYIPDVIPSPEQVVWTNVSSIVLNAKEMYLKKGKSATLTAIAWPEDATCPNIAWSSSDTSVATVEDGVVKAKKAGTAVITASAVDKGGAKDECTINVVSKLTQIKSISFNPASVSVPSGESEQLNVVLNPANATVTELEWKSSDTSVATVDASGVVTGLKQGTVTITAIAKDGSNKAGSCQVTVTAPPVRVTSVSLDKTALTVEVRTTATLTATAKPDDATNKKVTWESADPAIATVDENGVVTGVSTGTTTITATAKDGSGKSASCTVTVPVVKVTEVTLNKTSENLVAGKTLTLVATMKPDDAANKAVTWSSADSDIATVDENGVVTAVAAGTTTITATAQDGSGKSASCTVTVPPIKVTGLTVDPAPASVTTGKTVTLTATAKPENATDKTVTWSSANEKIATVDENGVVTGVAVGTTTITATAKDGSKVKATCKVTVLSAPVDVTGVTLDKTKEALDIDKTLTLTATVEPGNATDKTVVWTSSDEKIATVSATGLVTGVAVGTATITVTTNDGSFTAQCEVNVQKPVTSVTLDKTSETLEVSDTLTLTATVKPDDATNKAVTWTSSDEAVATVSEAGVVTAVAVGTADITATAKDGSGKFATCTITVTGPITVGDFVVLNGVVTAYNGKGGAVSIPENDGHGTDVTAIGESVFASNTAITSVTISAKVTEIKASAFEGCTALENVTIPNGVTTIGKAAFKGCTKLANMTTY